MVDVYTKAVLTVIAVALSAIAIRSAVPSALAVGDGCGRSSGDACYVTTSTRDPLYVTTHGGDGIAVFGKVEVYGTVSTD
jgi:hypothetical protein